MVGSGALIECLAHPDVEGVLAVGRRSCGVLHEKLEELVHGDLFDFSAVEDRFVGYDACLFCLGVSAMGMSEEDYSRITRDITIAAAEVLAARSPGSAFVYVSGAGADSSEKGRVMWARVRGRLENELLAKGLGPTWIFRPGFIQPMKGVRSRTKMYNALYTVLSPFTRLMPSLITTTEKLGLALIRAGRVGAPQPVLEFRAINALAEAESAYLEAG